MRTESSQVENETEQPPEGLTVQQWNVARKIAAGMSPAAAAKEQGARLIDVLEWRYHPAFVAWLRKSREAKVHLANAQVAGMVTEALNTLRKCMRSKDGKVALAASKEVLRLAGVEPEYSRIAEQERHRRAMEAYVRWIAAELEDEHARRTVLQLVDGGTAK